MQSSGQERVHSAFEPDVARLECAYATLNTNPENSIQELKALADLQSSLAPLHLGWVYQQGQLVPKNEAEAEHWFKLSYERGQELAPYYLGHYYLSLARNSEAVKVFERGSELGSLSCKFCLATAILDGKSELADVEKAKRLLVESADAGHAFAMRRLATVYLSGGFGELRRFYGVILWFKALLVGVYYAATSPEDDRLRA